MEAYCPLRARQQKDQIREQGTRERTDQLACYRMAADWHAIDSAEAMDYNHVASHPHRATRVLQSQLTPTTLAPLDLSAFSQCAERLQQFNCDT